MKYTRLLLLFVACCCSLQVPALDYTYKGVTFKFKVKGNYVVITSFDRKAADVIVPAQIETTSGLLPVKEISTFSSGDNYSARTIVLEEGIEVIGKSSFIEFRKLEKATLPKSIRLIGRNAFRRNASLIYSLPDLISEEKLRNGEEIKISESTPPSHQVLR